MLNYFTNQTGSQNDRIGQWEKNGKGYSPNALSNSTENQLYTRSMNKIPLKYVENVK